VPSSADFAGHRHWITVLTRRQTAPGISERQCPTQSFSLKRVAAAAESIEPRGNPAIPFRGPLLAMLAYVNLSLWEFNGLDILINRRDVSRTKYLLESEGYRPYVPMTELEEAAHLHSGCEKVFVRLFKIATRRSGGHLVMYYQALQRAQDNLREMLSGLANLYENNLFLTNVYEFLTLAPQISGPLTPQVIPRPMRQGISFENVSFRYRAGFHQALKDIRLTIEPGEIVALVGENGSGKTTLVKLLCRLYDPTIGRITLDGIDIREFDPSLLRREISVIFQDFVQYELTAKENIWFGNTELSPDHPRIVRSARESGADDVIRMLPRSYDTVLGKMFEEGEELSIGQWQKVALARAFLRNSQIIVLDEPTSALDAKAEYDVFNRFRELAEGRSALLISHRLSTVKMADTIYVLDQGQIVERGTHDQLVRHGATYANLFEMQAQSYR
jgi:ABC-type multidrug transport system fused ATPase/permease subunit